MVTIDPRHRVTAPVAADVRLMDAAERLVAIHRGVGVSDRAIITEAGQHNNSAITYHFGNRQGLMDAVWHRRLNRVSGRRDQMLEQLAQPLNRLQTRAVVTLYVKPLCDEIGSLQPSHWARFNERLLQDMPLNFIPWVRSDRGRFEGSASTDQLLALFGRLRSLLVELGFSSAMAENKVALAARFVIAALAGWERSVALGQLQVAELPALRDELIAMTVAMLETRSESRN